MISGVPLCRAPEPECQILMLMRSSGPQAKPRRSYCHHALLSHVIIKTDLMMRNTRDNSHNDNNHDGKGNSDNRNKKRLNLNSLK